MAKELRITFKDNETDLYEYLKGKSSPSVFLKNLADIERKREEVYINGGVSRVAELTPLVKEEPTKTTVVKDISELDISDLNV